MGGAREGGRGEFQFHFQFDIGEERVSGERGSSSSRSSSSSRLGERRVREEGKRGAVPVPIPVRDGKGRRGGR